MLRHIIIVAAGSGRRFGSEVPKQFLQLAGKPLLVHTLEAMARALPDAGITVVLSDECRSLWSEICATYAMPEHQVVTGGDTRWASVRNAVESLYNLEPSTAVLIHDGARPLVDAATVHRVASAVINTDGAIPVVPVTDSLRRIADDGVTTEAVDREVYRAVQTPQGFALWRLRQAYAEDFRPEFTDDASVMAAAGFVNLVTVAGNPANIKVTRPIDLRLAELLLAP